MKKEIFKVTHKTSPKGRQGGGGIAMKKIFKLAFIFLATSFSLVITKVSFAHDLWIYIENPYPSIGEKITAKIMFGHNFPYPDILISREKLGDFYYISPDGHKKEITNTWEEKTGEKTGSLVGEMIVEQEGSYIIATYRKRKGDKQQVASEKYAKSIISMGEGESYISNPLGHRIEIVPLKDPKDLKMGDNMPVRVLFEGKPLSTYLYATYAGYYSEDEPFPIVVKSNKKGVAYVKITQPGTWKFVCNHKVNFSATLTFKVEDSK